MKNLANNKKITASYRLLETYEAGLKLTGAEVKAAKLGHLSLKGSYVSLRPTKSKLAYEAWLVNLHISPYAKAAVQKSYAPTHERKLLLKKREIRSLIGRLEQKGLTLVPTAVYTKRHFVKVAVALAQGKTKHDKREDIKKREANKNIQQALKRRR